MHRPHHCSSPYTSDNDSDTPSSTSSIDNDNDDNETRTQRPRPTQSLGRMLPVPTHQLTPEFNAVRQHTVVVRSRDRSLWNEHLFQFGVSFGDVAAQLSQTEQLQRARLQTCYNVSDVPTGVPSSVQTGIAQLQSCPQPYTGMIAGANDGLACNVPNVFNTPRRCVVHRVYRNVVAFTLPHLILPLYPQMRFTPDPSDTTDPSLVRTIALTPDVLVEMQPSPNAEQLAGTDDTLRNSTFVMAPADDSAAHVHYHALNAPHEPLDTPINYLNHLRLTVHTPDECLRAPPPFVPDASPDVYRVTSISYTLTGAGSGEMEFTLNAPVPMVHYLWNGATSTPQHALHVSLRDVQLLSGGGSPSPEQRALYTYLCDVFSARCWVTQTYDPSTPTSVTVTIDDAPPSLAAASFCTVPTGTALLNESMQYTMVFHVSTAVRRLRMSVR